MMRWIVGSSLKFRLPVVAIAAVMMVLGIMQLRNVRVDALPEFTPPYVEIQTEALGLSAAEVEQLITVPLEADLLNGLAWLETIRSKSVPGMSSIVLVFQPGTNLLRARQLVQERLTQAHALPNVSQPPTMLQPLSSASRFMIVGLSSKNLSLIQQGVLARWTIRPRLMGVPGVANVSIFGQRDRQLQVQVDPARLKDANVSLLQVIQTAGNAMWVSPLTFLDASTPGTGGFIESAQQRFGVRHVSPIVSATDLAKVPVEGSTLRLGDVAKVVEDHQPLIGDAVTNGAAGLLLVIEKFPGTNTLEVTRGVEAALDELRPGLSGLELDSSIFRPATYIEMASRNLALALLIGFLLLVLALGAFFYSWRTALISLAAIPLSLVAAGLVLYLCGATINMMVLAGLAIAVGVIVDDAIIDVENIARRLRQQRGDPSAKSTAEIILEGSLKVRRTIWYGTLIIVLALLPVFFMRGPSGAFVLPLALSYGLAVAVSTLVALVVTPPLCLILLRNAPAQRRESPLVRLLHRGYDKAFARTIRTPRPALLAVAAMALVGVAVLPLLRQSLLPTLKEPDLLIHWNGAPGTSRQEMDRIVGQASDELRSVPGVRNVGAHVGRGVLSDQVGDVNDSELWVSMNPTADYKATVAAIQRVVNGYPGLERKVDSYLSERTNAVLKGPDKPITVRVYGEDFGILRGKAEEVAKILSGIDGIVGEQVEQQAQDPTLEVQVDLAAADEFGIKPGDVRRATATLLSGITVGSLFQEQKIFDVVVWGAPEIRQSLTNVRDLLIDTPDGGHVRLGDVANVHVATYPSVITHDAVSRSLDVTADVSGRDLGAVRRDIAERVKTITFPLEYRAELMGDYAARQATQQRMVGIIIAAAIGMLVLLQAAFGSWRLALMSFVTVPMALVGGVVAALLGGGVISLGSLVGFFTVLGIATRNGIMLVNHYQHLEQHEGEAFGPGLVLRGTRDRLVPIVMTATATALVLLPFVLLDIPGTEIVHPMAVVILGGLITSMLLNLFVVPALYLRFASIPDPGTKPAATTEARVRIANGVSALFGGADLKSSAQEEA
ncbi:MAG: efflux RND transporter permease subunit [Egibacteraceae bacterium]